MKTIVSSTGETVDSDVDQRFGRCQYFIIVETENKEIKNISAVENQGAIQGHGAGFKAAEQIGNLKPDNLITGHLGPNAYEVIQQLGIIAYYGSGKIQEVIEKMIKGGLSKITKNVEPHSGMSETKQENKDRIYFPLLDNNGMESQISEHFGHAPFFGLYDYETEKLTITENTLDHSNPNKSPIDQIIEAVNPTTIFAQGIGGRAVGLIKEKGLGLKTGNYKTVQEVIDNFDKLIDQTKDCGHQH